MRPRFALAALLAATLAGCSAPTAVPPPAAEPPPAAAVSSSATAAPDQDAWVDRICAAGVTAVTPAVAAPAITSTELPALRKALDAYLGGVVNGIRLGRTQLDAAGPSPIAGGDAAVARARTVLDGLERSVTDARDRLGRADLAAFATTLRDVESSIRDINAPEALRDVLAVPGIAAVADRSAACTELRALAARVPG